MKRSGAALAVYALEQVGIRRTFGIPGVHNTELYDALSRSDLITPYLVTHELGGAFMADGLSRTSDEVGAIVIVPGAGTTHALSGIAEAYLDGIPMLVISGGVRRDSGRSYQLHDIDQGKMLEPVTKSYHLVTNHADVVPSIYAAYEAATTGVPGPAFVEIPVEIQLFRGDIDHVPAYEESRRLQDIDPAAVAEAVDMLKSARKPGLYVGWGAVDAANLTAQIADILVAPVATTLQGLSAFPATHPFHTGLGFGPAAVPAGRKSFSDCDCLLAVGVRFSELGTGSYGLEVPENLIHVDISPDVFDRNYPAKVRIAGDASVVLKRILDGLNGFVTKRSKDVLANSVRDLKQEYLAAWMSDDPQDRVAPGPFFRSLRESTADNAVVVVDDGIHTFLAAELFPVRAPRCFISPTDFNSMGYCIPAAIGSKMGSPKRQVVAIVGDGAFMMTGMELITASRHGLGIAVFVFHDGELGQISQFQEIPLNRKTCTVIGDLQVQGVALATGCEFLDLPTTDRVDEIVRTACRIAATGRPVIVDVRIDYSRKTRLTKGAVQTNLKRFPAHEKARFVGRALWRHMRGPAND